MEMRKPAPIQDMTSFMSQHFAGNTMISVERLHTGASYQRNTSQSKVTQLTREWNDAAAGSLVVSLRDNGEEWIVDGQHRYSAMLARGIKYARCDRYVHLTEEDEAQIWIFCNVLRKAPGELERHPARLLSGDPVAIDIDRVLQDNGLKIGKNKEFKDPDTIQAVQALLQIYQAGGAEHLNFIIQLLMRAYPEDGQRWQQDMLLGLHQFTTRYAGKYELSRLLHVLSKTGCGTILTKSNNLVQVRSGARKTAVAEIIQQVYDKQLSDQRRLRPDPL